MLSSKAAYIEGTSGIHFLNFLMCHLLLLPLEWGRLIILYTSSRVEFKQLCPVCHCDRKWVSAFRWFPHSHLQEPEVPVWSLPLHHCICSAGWAVLQTRCGSPGIEAGGVEDGNLGLTVAELLNYSCRPTLPASIPLCSASTETSITVWMKDIWLSPSLNHKWGTLCCILQHPSWKQLRDTAIMMPQGMTGAEIGLPLHQNFGRKNSPEVILLSLCWK